MPGATAAVINTLVASSVQALVETAVVADCLSELLQLVRPAGQASVLTMCRVCAGEGETVLRARFKAVNEELTERFRALEEEFR